MTDAAEIHPENDQVATAGSGDDTFDLAPFIDAWRRELTDQTSIPAGAVQDRLLELWGDLDAGQERTTVEEWLTETLGRHLYQADDVTSRLDRLVASESAPAAG